MDDAENMVLFDLEGSFSIPGKSPEAAIVRRAIRKCKRAIQIHRRKNSFYIPLWVQPQSNGTNGSEPTPFQGQGKA